MAGWSSQLSSTIHSCTCHVFRPYLCFLTLRALGLAAEALRTLGLTDTVLKLLDALAGLRSFRGERFACWARTEAMCLSSSSPIVALRRATGIRFTRRSIRARRSFAWRAYCARSLRARSVTVAMLVGFQDKRGIERAHVQAASCQSKLAFVCG